MIDPVQPVKVLIADDDGPFCDAMSAVLKLKTYVTEVRTAQRGLQALYSCVDFEPEVVFIDSLMPAMDGDVLGSKVRSLLPTARLVSISGSTKEKPSWADIHVTKGGFLFDRMDETVMGGAPDRT